MLFLSILKNVGWVISFVLAGYSFYFAIISIFSLIPSKKRQQHEAKTKFAAVIAARNEGLVIGNLIESIKLQNYPKDLIDIIVIPNNCTDDTEEVSIQSGAKIFKCKGIIKSKGEALSEFFDDILHTENDYDAFCIFDADNLVHGDFFSQMNNAVCDGAKIGQGYRDSKNPRDSIISSCYSIYYYIVNRFHNRARSAMKLSAMINGSGFMVKKEIIEQHNGWHTKSMTEDIEFTTLNILKGNKVEWVPEAVIFDEQPLTFEESWKQRKRWSTGLIQCSELYSGKLFKNFFKNKNFSNLDMVMFFISPVIQVIYFISLIITLVLNVFYINPEYFPTTDAFFKMFLSIQFSFLVSFSTALIVVLLEKKRHMLKGIVAFWFFLFTWLPINLICIFKKQTVWTEIKHTRVMKIDDVSVRYEEV